MKKNMLFLILSVFLVILAACGSSSDLNEGEEEFVFKFNANFSTDDLDNTPALHSLQEFKDEVEEKSDGRLKIDIFLDGQLGKTTSEVVGGAQSGSFEMFNLASANWTEYTDAFVPFNVPYLITDVDVGQEIINGPEGQKMKDKVLEDTDIRVAFIRDQGFRHMVNDKKPIESPDDLKGLKMRVLPDPFTIKSYELMGASTVSVAYSELYTSAQQGVIDGLDALYADILNSKLHEVQGYLTATKNGYTPVVVGVANEAYQSLPDDLKNIFDEAAETAQQRSEADDLYTEKVLEELQKTMEFNELTPEQLQLFKDETEPVKEMAEEKMGKEKWNDFITELESVEEKVN